MSKFKKLTFLKVLTTVAWADGEVTQSELNILKSFYRKFDLEKNELDELKPYLHAPISNKEKDLFFTISPQLVINCVSSTPIIFFTTLVIPLPHQEKR